MRSEYGKGHPDAANQLTYSEDISGRTTYTFDANGNQQLVQSPTNQRTTTTWDYENRTTLVQRPSGIRNTMAYNPDGLRVKLEESTGTKKFIWDDENYLAESDNNNDTQVIYTNEPRIYGNLISQRRGATTNWYHYNAQGTTSDLTDASQNITDTYLLDAWGVPISSTGTTVNPFRFIGELGYYRDVDTGNDYVRARIYRPVIGRWLSVDPLPFLDGFNLYVAYFVLSKVDPSGLAWITCVCSAISDNGTTIDTEVSVDCRGLAVNCCTSGCPPHFYPTGDWEFERPSNDSTGCRFFARPDITGNVFADTCQCAHYDIYSTCHGEVVTGIGGQQDVQTTQNGSDIMLVQVASGRLWYGSDAELSCAEATYGQVLDCLENRPHPGPYNAFSNNCQGDIERTSAQCCLTGFTGVP